MRAEIEVGGVGFSVQQQILGTNVEAVFQSQVVGQVDAEGKFRQRIVQRIDETERSADIERAVDLNAEAVGAITEFERQILFREQGPQVESELERRSLVGIPGAQRGRDHVE